MRVDGANACHSRLTGVLMIAVFHILLCVLVHCHWETKWNRTVVTVINSTFVFLPLTIQNVGCATSPFRDLDDFILVTDIKYLFYRLVTN